MEFYKKLLGSLLGAKGQVVLLLVILLAAAVTRYSLPNQDYLSLDKLGFSSSTATEPGTVVYSDASQDLFLLVVGGNLLWRRGDESSFIAEDVINLHTHKGRFWIKTKTEVSELIISNGAVVQQLHASSPGCRDFAFAESRLVGTGDREFFLSTGPQVYGLAQWGLVEGPYHLEGRRDPQFLEGDWRQGVVFIEDNAWTVYINYMPQVRVKIEYDQGQLQGAVLAPDAATIIYAVQQGADVEVWHSKVAGIDEAELLYQQEMQFSSLEAIWAPDLSLTIVSVLGYEGEADFDDNFHSATFLYQPGQTTAMLNRSYGSQIRALFPTAWDSRENLIWFNWLHEEVPVPVSYSLFSH